MLAKKVDKTSLKSLKSYLKKEGRVAFQLRQCHQLIKAHPQPSSILKCFAQPHTVAGVFKVLILLHRIIIEHTLPVPSILDLLSSISSVPSDPFSELLQTKFIKPYQFYLQKRCSTVLDATSPKHKSSQERLELTYQLINLINTATSFTDILYTFGRYYLYQYGCAIDFNIAMGIDLQALYTEMVGYVQRPPSPLILQQIEAMHQRMYIVYYNCYFHKYLKNWVPKWVLTDNKPSTPEKQPNRHKRTCSAKSTASSKKTNEYGAGMGDSCAWLGAEEEYLQHVQEEEEEWDEMRRKMRQKQQMKKEEGLKLLMSMERVVSFFPQ